jgi:hypothetical protein
MGWFWDETAVGLAVKGTLIVSQPEYFASIIMNDIN